jgi:hypothetical protein
MIIEKVQRVANPTRSKRKYKAKKNPRKRVKLSAKQIRAGFGGKKRKAASRVCNPKMKQKRAKTKVRVIYRTKPAKRKKNPRKRAYNPAVMTIGLLNPERTTKKVSKTKAKKYARRRTRAKNPSTSHRRRYQMKTKPVRRHRQHKNPDFLGSGMEAIGILVGVAVQKVVKGFVPSTLTAGNALMTTGVSFALALLIGKGADMVMKGKPIGKGVALGALASAASDAINAFVPQLSGTIGLNGLGVYQNAIFAVPENPIMRGLPAPSVPVAAKGMGGAMTAAFGHSF